MEEKIISVTKYTNHEDFDSVSFNNDITLIELAQEVDLRVFTPACLARRYCKISKKKSYKKMVMVLFPRETQDNHYHLRRAEC